MRTVDAHLHKYTETKLVVLNMFTYSETIPKKLGKPVLRCW